MASSARAKFCILDPGGVFKDYDLHRVQSLEEKLEDLASLSLNYLLNYWLPKFVQEGSSANKNEIVNSAPGMFNSGTFLNCTVNVNVNVNVNNKQ